MKLQVVTFEVAKLAKEKGFTEECHHAYEDEHGELQSSTDMTGEPRFTIEDIEAARSNDYDCCLAPYQQELQRWLREEHKIDMLLLLYDSYYYYSIYKSKKYIYTGSKASYIIYEEAFEAGLLNGLKKLP